MWWQKCLEVNPGRENNFLFLGPQIRTFVEWSLCISTLASSWKAPSANFPHVQLSTKPQFPFGWIQSNHRIIEPQNGLGWKGQQCSSRFHPPAMCRVAKHQTRLLRATSSLSLNASRDGASTTSLGNLFREDWKVTYGTSGKGIRNCAQEWELHCLANRNLRMPALALLHIVQFLSQYSSISSQSTCGRVVWLLYHQFPYPMMWWALSHLWKLSRHNSLFHCAAQSLAQEIHLVHQATSLHHCSSWLSSIDLHMKCHGHFMVVITFSLIRLRRISKVSLPWFWWKKQQAERKMKDQKEEEDEIHFLFVELNYLNPKRPTERQNYSWRQKCRIIN